MQYRVIHVDRGQNDRKGEKFSEAIQDAMNSAHENGDKVLSIVPVENAGITVGVLIAVERRTA